MADATDDVDIDGERSRLSIERIPLQDNAPGKTFEQGPQRTLLAELTTFLNWRTVLDRKSFFGALIYNLPAILIVALLPIYRKSWLPKAKTSDVRLLNGFRHVHLFSSIVSESLPRAGWVVLGDKESRSYSERLRLAHTMLLFQLILGSLVVMLLSSFAPAWMVSNLPPESAKETLVYIKLSIYLILPAAVDAALAVSARALDRPDVPLLGSVTNLILNVGSSYYVESWGPGDLVTTHTRIALAGDTLAVVVGFVYFYYTATSSQSNLKGKHLTPSPRALCVLLVPGGYTFTEALARNGLRLAAVNAIGPMRILHEQAYAIYRELRRTLNTISASILEVTALTWISHNWSELRASLGGAHATFVRANFARARIFFVPVCICAAGAFTVEMFGNVYVADVGIQEYVSKTVSNPRDVVEMTKKMWAHFEAQDVFYVLGLQVAALLLATKPAWWMMAGLATQILYVVPATLTYNAKEIRDNETWEYNGKAIEGSRVFWFVSVVAVVLVWTLCLLTGWKGRLRFDTFRKA